MYKLFLCLRYLRKRRIAFFAVAAVCLCVAMVLIVFSVMDGFLQMVKDRSRGLLGDLVMEVPGALQGFPYYDDFIDQLKTEMPDEIKQITPVIITYGVLRYQETQITKPVQIVGIKLAETYRVNDFKKGLFYEKYYPGTTNLGEQKKACIGLNADGQVALPAELEEAWQKWFAQASPKDKEDVPTDKYTSFYKRPGYFPLTPIEGLGARGPGLYGDDLPGVILGTDLCAIRNSKGQYDRQYSRGHEVVLTLIPFTDTGKILGSGSGMPSKIFRYVDDSRTGVFDIDSMSVYVDFDLLQDILEMTEHEYEEDLEDGATVSGTVPARTTQIQIKLKTGVDPISTRDVIRQKWSVFANERIAQVRTPYLLEYVRVLTWEEKQARFISAVEKEKYLVTILFGVISLVAVFLVGCIFYMIVQQKTQDIGIIKSVGGTSLGVASIFIAYGAAVGIVGGLLGTVIGTMFVWYINEFQDLLARISPHAVVWDPAIYTFDKIPSQVKLEHVVVIYFIAIFASTFGSLMAAWRAAKVWPVEALRYE